MAETKSERLEQFKRDLFSRELPLSEMQIRERILSAFSRGYDDGFADGFESGTRTATQVQEFVNDALFNPRTES